MENNFLREGPKVKTKGETPKINTTRRERPYLRRQNTNTSTVSTPPPPIEEETSLKRSSNRNRLLHILRFIYSIVYPILIIIYLVYSFVAHMVSFKSWHLYDASIIMLQIPTIVGYALVMYSIYVNMNVLETEWMLFRVFEIIALWLGMIAHTIYILLSNRIQRQIPYIVLVSSGALLLLIETVVFFITTFMNLFKTCRTEADLEDQSPSFISKMMKTRREQQTMQLDWSKKSTRIRLAVVIITISLILIAHIPLILYGLYIFGMVSLTFIALDMLAMWVIVKTLLNHLYTARLLKYIIAGYTTRIIVGLIIVMSWCLFQFLPQECGGATIGEPIHYKISFAIYSPLAIEEHDICSQVLYLAVFIIIHVFLILIVCIILLCYSRYLAKLRLKSINRIHSHFSLSLSTASTGSSTNSLDLSSFSVGSPQSPRFKANSPQSPPVPIKPISKPNS
mmetsp:Transcript_2601/g.3747  ORF Transcript_2601/g.3747 Transcript_2601/m.3747 type:complete len:452 (-) Transcript_2601:17-1372(-)